MSEDDQKQEHVSRRTVLKASGSAAAVPVLGAGRVSGTGATETTGEAGLRDALDRCPDATIRPSMGYCAGASTDGCADDHPVTIELREAVEQTLESEYPDAGALLEAGFKPYFDTLDVADEDGWSHWLHPEYIGDEAMLDPERPESVLVDNDSWRSIGVMFIATIDGEPVEPPPAVYDERAENGDDRDEIAEHPSWEHHGPDVADEFDGEWEHGHDNGHGHDDGHGYDDGHGNDDGHGHDGPHHDDAPHHNETQEDGYGPGHDHDDDNDHGHGHGHGTPPDDHEDRCSPWHYHAGLPGRFAWWYYQHVYEQRFADGEVRLPCRTPCMLHVWTIDHPEGVYAHDAPPAEYREQPPVSEAGFETDADPSTDTLGWDALPANETPGQLPHEIPLLDRLLP
ncbi:uncharacterized protein Nmag_2288 [Natrialba magadii ATCC 43099]|uniref:Uncharacterized protein n=1 Tax=Natrialba magadii (strain ATCC 43099 / DSM 3394 / CCM 3739 / CIP 104546 / IAM 13178 / JCM 8861 / NBRC 102185 / NCIMB 2190 / MS3) TaxID=547559 RepID=D3SWX0_NATMM|nr:twin-arginine translocation signal domain-containing protein [Natrialba magadii]ADD05852.1 uncharacterized protein Nmag_2288 [Natrialba magadii ATCC 43099]ELY30640.1 hypothetical protein C500_08972 [Natrialba magadii ATCC 43099]